MKFNFKFALVAFMMMVTGSSYAESLTVDPFDIGPGQTATLKFKLTGAHDDIESFDVIFNLPKGVYPASVAAPEYASLKVNEDVTFNTARVDGVTTNDFGLYWRNGNEYNMKLMVTSPKGIVGKDGDWIFAIDVYADETVETGEKQITFDQENTGFWGTADDYMPEPDPVDVNVSDKFVVNIPASGWATLCSVVDLDITGLNVYAVTKAEGGKTEVEKIEGALKAGVGALIKGEAGKVEIPAGSGATEPATNFLVGVKKFTPNPSYGTVYFLKDGIFKKAAKTAALSAGKAYLSMPASSAKDFDEFEIVINDPTAIKAIETEQNAGVLYNLNGVRVDNPTKGVYIQNGRKVVVK